MMVMVMIIMVIGIRQRGQVHGCPVWALLVNLCRFQCEDFNTDINAGFNVKIALHVLWHFISKLGKT